MFGLECKQGVKDNMKLLWNSELIPACNWHFFAVRGIGIPQTFFQIKEFDLKRNSYLSCHSSINVGTESSGVSNQEAVRRFDLNLK